MKIDIGSDSDLNAKLVVETLDGPGPSGAHHRYSVRCGHEGHGDSERCCFATINFQEGGLRDSRLNGCSEESLLAIVRHRLECFQAGPFECDENVDALIHVKYAIHALNERTADRVARGVEGRSEP